MRRIGFSPGSRTLGDEPDTTSRQKPVGTTRYARGTETQRKNKDGEKQKPFRQDEQDLRDYGEREK